jgi:hypothetical protein
MVKTSSCPSDTSFLLVQLIPFIAFSIFHVLNYFRTTFLPVLLPVSTARYYDQLLNRINIYQSWVIGRVAFVEILIAINMIGNMFL